MTAKDFKSSLYGRPATIKTKRSLFENHVQPYLRISHSTDQLVDTACKGWKDDQLSIGTIKSCFVLLAEYIKFTTGLTIDKKKLNYLYFSDLTKPPQKLKVWNKLEVKTVLLQAKKDDPELYKLMVVALGTGMRRGEIFGLKWGDVNFFDCEVTISRSLDISSGEVGPTKTRQGRTVQMSLNVSQVLESLYKVGDIGFIFPDYYDPNARLEKVAKAACVPVLTCHDLRHTCATMLFEANLRVKFISRMLGHAKLSTTLDIYIGCTTIKPDLDNIYV